MITTKTIYVAGAYSAPNAWEREANIRRAEEVCMRLWAAGVPAICVHTMARYFHGRVSEEHAIAIGLELLRRCDAVQLVPGWIDSNGTLREVGEAHDREMPVFAAQELDACIEWAKGKEQR